MFSPIRPPAFSTSLDLEHFPPDISTPEYVPTLPPSRTISHVSQTHNQSQNASISQSIEMDLVSPESVKPSWEDQNEPPGVLSTREGVSNDSAQCELPFVLPTPGRELGRLTDQAHDHLDKLQQKQDKVQRSRFHLESKLNKLSEQTEQSLRNLHTIVSSSKDKFDHEMDAIMKANKAVISSEVDKAKVSIVSELGFMIKQMQIEFQDELQDTQRGFEEKNVELVKCLGDCSSMLKVLSTKMDDVSGKVNSIDVTHKSEMEGIQDRIKQITLPAASFPQSSSIVMPAISGFTPVSKTDHIRLTFPTYGRPGDDSDPLLYLSKCDDFLALHPLADTDILATFRTVLHGTARDWWEITRTKVTSWEEFKASFVSAFLAEDYEDELAERFRTKKQGENESIRDFAYSYRALCTRWNPDLTELDIVKLIVKHIKPYLASQLRGRVNDVDELVRLGHQLERDHDQQLEYERKLQVRKVNSLQKGTYPGSQQGEKTPLCGAAKGCILLVHVLNILLPLLNLLISTVSKELKIQKPVHTPINPLHQR